MELIVDLVLIGFGLVAVVAGILVFRSAERFVTGASQTLRDMFGEGFPGLFEAEPDARGGHITGVAFGVCGVALIAFGVIRLLVAA